MAENFHPVCPRFGVKVLEHFVTCYLCRNTNPNVLREIRHERYVFVIQWKPENSRFNIFLLIYTKDKSLKCTLCFLKIRRRGTCPCIRIMINCPLRHTDANPNNPPDPSIPPIPPGTRYPAQRNVWKFIAVKRWIIGRLIILVTWFLRYLLDRIWVLNEEMLNLNNK